MENNTPASNYYYMTVPQLDVKNPSSESVGVQA